MTGNFRGQYINIHSGGEVYTNSAGCQTIIKPQYPQFQKESYQLLDDAKQELLPYLLIGATELDKYNCANLPDLDGLSQ